MSTSLVLVPFSFHSNIHDSDLLKESSYGNDEDIKTMLEFFDKSTKPVFRDENEASYIKFGSKKDNDVNVNVRSGQLMLTGCVTTGIF